MDSINSFKGYGKVHAAGEQAFRRKSLKRYSIIAASAFVLLLIIVAAVVGTRGRDSDSPPAATSTSPSASIKAVCSVTQYQDACISSLSSANSTSKGDPEELFRLSMKVASDEIVRTMALTETLKGRGNTAAVKGALDDCRSLFQDAIEQLNSSMEAFRQEGGTILSAAKIEDIRTWLSAALTDLDTCLDGLGESSPEFRNIMASETKNSSQYTSNSLAIATKIISILGQLDISLHRKLLGAEFPTWVSAKDRRLLQTETPKADAIVAQDGSGNFTTIGEAVKSAPEEEEKRFVICIKAGTYRENVVVEKRKWNVMMAGESPETTIVSGELNFVDGTPTFDSGTVIAVGKGFIARDITFINTAGPEKHQAVALRSSSDRSVFYRCTFDGHQDTLYAHSLRHFYRDCTIRGTVDFIFGNAAAVFQNCLIQPREPDPGQKNTVTAQGKTDPNQNTGFSIQACRISPLGNVTAQTFFGRPWKHYSTTVVMQSDIDGILDGAGWLPWEDGTLPPETIFYAEHKNRGPGSSVEKRVKWAGYRGSISEVEAAKFTVEKLIQGSEWLPESGVAFGAGL